MEDASVLVHILCRYRALEAHFTMKERQAKSGWSPRFAPWCEQWDAIGSLDRVCGNLGIRQNGVVGLTDTVTHLLTATAAPILLIFVVEELNHYCVYVCVCMYVYRCNISMLMLVYIAVLYCSIIVNDMIASVGLFVCLLVCWILFANL